MCRHDGWEFACADWGMQVFYNQRPDPVPLETEPALEVDRIHTTAMCWLVPVWLFLVAGNVLNIWQNIQRHNKLVAMGLPQEMQGGYWNPGWVVSEILQCLLILLSIVLYFRWYHRAKKAAREGVFSILPRFSGPTSCCALRDWCGVCCVFDAGEFLFASPGFFWYNGSK